MSGEDDLCVHNSRMASSVLSKTVIVDLPYATFEDSQVEEILNRQLGELSSDDVAKSRHALLDYPTVYVVHADRNTEYTVYVGETNNIRRRTKQHISRDSIVREDWSELRRWMDEEPENVSQYVIGNEHFNKSLTLDVENRLMNYLLGSHSVKKLNNRRTNAQGDYYTKEEFEQIFNEIWLGLHDMDPNLFPAEQIIRDSALFKASPFHELSNDQVEAENIIMSVVEDLFESSVERLLAEKTGFNTNQIMQEDHPKLIFVQGAAGTGKTVLLSHLFYRLSVELGFDSRFEDEDDEDMLSSGIDMLSRTNNRQNSFKSYVLVNHHEQKTVYNQIAVKLGLQDTYDDVVLLPSEFINRFSESAVGKNGKPTGRGIPSKPRGKADVILVDESHLLLTQGSQSYSGENMLYDLLRRAKVVIAVFDPQQILQSAQQWDSKSLTTILGEQLDNNPSVADKDAFDFVPMTISGDIVDVCHIRLEQQFRIAADEATFKWLDDFIGSHEKPGTIGKIPHDRGEKNEGRYLRDPYEIRIFDSPIELMSAIKDKAKEKADGENGHGLSRVLATYDWPYKKGRPNPNSPDGYWNVELYRSSIYDDDTGEEKQIWRMGHAPNDEGKFDVENPDGNPSRFCHPWNYCLPELGSRTSAKDGKAWAEKDYTIDEIGSTFTIQGFDLNFAGVIIGPSVKYKNGHIVFDKTASKNTRATNMRNGSIDYSESNLRNELNVLLKRGVHGLYLFAVDPELQKALKDAAK